MVQRTLTALFSLAVLILPASQLYADSDMMTSVYSGLECKYEDDRWDLGKPAVADDPATANVDESMPAIPARLIMTYAEMADVVSHTRLGIGNNAPRTDLAQTDGDHSMTVSCPLPSLGKDDMGNPDYVVIVGVIDGTVFDDVTCRVQSCVVGLGIGAGGEGNCKDSTPASTHANRAGFVSTAQTSPVTQGANYITQNISWLRLEAPDVQNIDRGARNEDPESDSGVVAKQSLGAVYTHLLCTLPEQDDVSPTAPGLYGQMRDEMGTSYIQSYYVDDVME
jgi:hypothetical protein